MCESANPRTASKMKKGGHRQSELNQPELRGCWLVELGGPNCTTPCSFHEKRRAKMCKKDNTEKYNASRFFLVNKFNFFIILYLPPIVLWLSSIFPICGKLKFQESRHSKISIEMKIHINTTKIILFFSSLKIFPTFF